MQDTLYKIFMLRITSVNVVLKFISVKQLKYASCLAGLVSNPDPVT